MCSAFQLHTVLKLLVIVCIASRACYGLRCFMGVSHLNAPVENVDSVGEPEVFQCSNVYQHQQEIIKQNEDGSMTTHINVSYSLHSSESADVSATEVTNCIVFYNANKDKADFACDYDNICGDATQTKQTSVCHKGSRGSLFCCQGDLCNTKSHIRHMSRPQAATICYNGTNSGSVDIGETHCKSSWCYQSSTYMANSRLIEQKFGCDAECDDQDFELTESTCRQKLMHGGIHQRICYCSTDRCNSVVNRIAPGSSDTEPGHFPSTLPPYLRMHNPDVDEDRHRDHMTRRWLMFGSWIGAGVFGLLLLSLIGMAVHRCRQLRATRISFSYSQLDDDVAEPEPADVGEKMVVA